MTTITRLASFNCILLILFISSNAQPFVFNRVPLFEENTRGFITSMAQDSKGYMWFTGLELYRYDGYHVVTYKNDPLDPNSLSPSRLECIYIDKQDMIWIGTVGSGLDMFNPSTGIVTHYRNDPDDPSSISSNVVTVITEDKDGDLWVGTHGGLNRLNKKTGKFTRYLKNLNDSTSLSNDQVRAIYQDKQGTLWIGCGSPYNNETPPGEGGLNRMDRKTGKFIHYMHDPDNPHTLINNMVRALYEDSHGNFWVGTFGDGLHIMDREKGTFTRFTYDSLHPEKLSSPVTNSNYHGVSFITEDKAGKIWIGAFLAGLSCYDPRTAQLSRFKIESENAKALNENTVWNACFSRDGVLWITTQAYVYRVDPLRKGMPHIFIGARVHSFYEDRHGTLWMASDTGLIAHNIGNNTNKYFLHDAKDPASINSNIVISVYQDKQGLLWAGTDSGLNVFNRSTNSFTRFEHDAKDANSITQGQVLSIYEDCEGLFWIATATGLNLMDRKTGRFKHYTHSPSDSGSIGSSTIYKIAEDKAGDLWIGTWRGGGVNLFDRKKGDFKHYLRGINVNDIFQNTDGVIWLATQNGLYRYDSSVDNFFVYDDPASEIGSANIIGITEDAKKNLWLGSHSAIIRLDLQKNQTAVFGRKYDVIPNSVYDLIPYKTSTGELLFGDATGYYELNPQTINAHALAPQLQITDFKIDDVSLKPGESPLTEPLDKLQKITLRYKQKNFSIDFSAINYSSIDENRHVYMLQNYDDKWRKAGAEKTASYYNVPPGDYVFKVKASNSDGVWAEKDLAIIITPPWWFTWWAYLLYAILTAAIIWGIVYFRSRRLIKEKQQLAYEVKIRTEQVVKQNEEISMQRDNLEKALQELQRTQAQLIQREKMASLGELSAGLAHEIQNPLNFVNNFSELNTELIEELQHELQSGDTEEAQAIVKDMRENLQKVTYHGKRAEGIIKGMLYHSRFGTGISEPTNINSLITEYIGLSYQGLRTKDKSFTAKYTTVFDESIGKINVVPQDIGRMLLNLFNNAFYAMNEKRKTVGDSYNPLVTVETKKLNDKIEIRVSDNGTGVPKNIIDKIFQPFFTTKQTGEGTGLGLSLSYDIIKAHGGEIKVETQEGEYATFIILLPYSES
jgi:ligand-binding sensor domain-containing protein/signal transduction histidine kinase